MYSEVFQQLGLAKNEAKIYEVLITHGESSISVISIKSGVHRRNVYDSINRLIEKGLVFEKIQKSENLYQPIDPQKLMELIEEKQTALKQIMPQLQRDFHKLPLENEVYVYKGAEGWKNYFRDMLRINQPAYCFGAKGGWLDPRVKAYFPTFIKQAQKQKLEFWTLFDHEVQEKVLEIIPYVGKNYRFLPQAYSTDGAVDVFGDHVNIISKLEYGAHPEEICFTVIVNQQAADSFRTWFKYMWAAAASPLAPLHVRRGESENKIK